ncbi:MAG: hypothetical protein ACI9ST_000880 [Psychrobacter glaciei]|jgi:hypothetical protein|uniref:adenylate/guanylate cyclase domain-containing protein n=1 Tax=Psychrobacter glaciei TaxID=619771 RepID=UPI0039E59A2B
MSEYDYKQGKNRVESILDNYMEIEEKDRLPSDDNFTFENGYLSWVTAIFVDIRDSTSLFSNNDEPTAKLVRAFTSEIIEILREDENMREIGIRGDCVYAIYTTPSETEIYECAQNTVYVNTFINMFNKLLEDRGEDKIRVGIGMATDKELVIKAGRKGVGINSKVWIGKAVTIASKLSSHGEKSFHSRLMYSPLSYEKFIEELEKSQPNDNVRSWFSYDSRLGAYKSGVIVSEFQDWIKNDFGE